MNQNLLEKYRKLQEYLLELEEVVVVYTGGVESTLLLKIAYDILNQETLALMAKFEAMSEKDFEYALISAREIGVYPIALNIDPNDTREINCLSPNQYCYYEKQMLIVFNRFLKANQLLHLAVATPIGVDQICENDDCCDKINVLKPFEAFNFSDNDIKDLAKELRVNSSVNYLPALQITSYYKDNYFSKDLLDKKNKAEEFLRNLNFRSVRIRMQNNVLYLTVDQKQMQLIYNNEVRKNIISFMKNLGFKDVFITATENAII